MKTIKTIITLSMYTALLMGCTYLGYLGFQLFELGPSTQHALDIFNSEPELVILSCLSPALLITLFIWKIKTAQRRRLHKEYKTLDSEALDKNQRLARQFYSSAYYFRCKYGEKKFRKHFIRHFDFFYDYHNQALNWLNDLFDINSNTIPPHDFVISTISSGQIGHAYMWLYSGVNIRGTNIKAGDGLLAHAKNDFIEFWSDQSPGPIFSLYKQGLKFSQAHRHPDYISCIFSGQNKSKRIPLQLELRFYTYPHNIKNATRNESYATQSIQAFKLWLKKIIKSKNLHGRRDLAIDVSVTNNSARKKTTPLNQFLHNHVQNINATYFSKNVMPIAEAGVALDAVVLINGLGIVVITEKHYRGDIYFSGDTSWLIHDQNKQIKCKNACLEAQHAKQLLARLLCEHSLTRWPILSLVVLTHPQAEVTQVIGKQRIQCDVIKLNELGKWFAQHKTDDSINFSKTNRQQFKQLLDNKIETQLPDIEEIILSGAKTTQSLF